ncbi:MAG: sigma-70 family RNA polymerase sigma factor [bacterium]|nr:MAG: sigma-70 family RNA polymerase sigma factor [bacterium]
MERTRERECERELVQRARRGDDNAFEDLVRAHQKPIFSFIYRLSGDPEITAEVTQMAFIKAYSGLGGFRGDASFRTWLYRIAVNTFRNHVRDESRRSHQEVDDNMPSSDEGAFEVLNHQQERRMLWEAVQTLPERQREALVLRVQEGYPFTDVARIMRCSVGSAKANYHQAVQKLKAALGE